MEALGLLNEVARHLTGKAVHVSLQQPLTAGAKGETWLDWDAEDPVQISIDPSVTFDGCKYLDTFLHECAHARLHTELMVKAANWVPRQRAPGAHEGAIKALVLDDGGVAEAEARALACQWRRYAEWNMEFFPSNAPSKAAAAFHSKLLALMHLKVEPT